MLQINLKQIRSDISGPIVFQGASGLKRSLDFQWDDTDKVFFINGKAYFGGSNSPSALLHINAGSTLVSPIRFTTGPLTTGINQRSGNFEFFSDRLYVTRNDGTTRETLAYLSDISSPVFSQDITVSLSGSKTIGKYVNGDTIPATGKTAEEVIRLIAIEDIAPTYTVAALNLTKSSASRAEVGTSYSNNLQATFSQNDACSLTNIRIQKNGSDMTPNGSSSPFSKTDTGTYPLGNVTYQAFANYGAGSVKNYLPSGTPDGRTPLVRNANAPQAAENNFASSSITINGAYLIFFGPTASIPSSSADARSLGTNRYTDAGNTFNLLTGTTLLNYAVVMPSTNSLVQVLDLDALNANITGQYVLTTFSVNDASGSPVSYKCYTMTIAVTYPSSHRHQITIS